MLQLAEDPWVPLLERVKFCAIYEDNLDEFYMVRVAGLHDQVEAKLDARGADGIPPGEVIEPHPRARDRAARAAPPLLRGRVWSGARRARHPDDLAGDADEAEREEIERIFPGQVFPALTPLVIGRGRPFPYISNISLSIAVLLRNPEKDEEVAARVKVPKELLRRFLPIGDGRTFVPLEDVIAANLDDLFPGMEIVHHSLFRVTRDTDYDVSDEADDLLLAVEEEVRRRRFGEVVRLEVSPDMEPRLRDQLVEALKIEERQVYDVAGLLGLDDLGDVAECPGFRELRYPPWQGVTPPRLQQGQTHREVDVLGAIREGDILVHHPYDSFTTSVERFVRQAVEDPNVLAIKQTVYRTSADSPLVPGLIEASERGKQAVCLVELKARFDESANIRWAKALEEAGRPRRLRHPRAEDPRQVRAGRAPRGRRRPQLRPHRDRQLQPEDRAALHRLRPVHRRPEIGADIAEMFNYLTGYARPQDYRKVLVAPFNLKEGIVGEIERRHRGPLARAARADPDEDELAARPALHPGALPRLAGRRQGRPQRARHLRAAPRGSPASRRTSGSSRSSAASSSTRGSTRSSAAASASIGSADLMPRNLYNRVELLSPVEERQRRTS